LKKFLKQIKQSSKRKFGKATNKKRPNVSSGVISKKIGAKDYFMKDDV